MPELQDVTFGAPCWADLSSSDPQRAAKFYGGLFGWEAEVSGPEYGYYTTFRKDGAMVGAVVGKMPGMEGTPDAWTTYFAVQDASATANAAKEAGGQVFFDPLDVMGMGTMAVLADPTGAAVGLWQPGTHRGFQRIAEPGAPCWFELLTRDLDGAASFYSRILGVDVSDMETGPDEPAYKTIDVDGEPHAGLFDMTGLVPDEVPPYWSVYFVAPNLEEALAYIREQGGQVLTEPAPSPYGRWSMVADPMGAAFAVLSE